MKLLKYGFYLLAIAASAVSCTRKDGDWDPIKTDCREITVPPQGGSAVVTMKNYKGWWISTVQYEAKGENLMIHGEDFGFMKFENEWCEIVVPSESPNKLYAFSASSCRIGGEGGCSEASERIPPKLFRRRIRAIAKPISPFR